MKILLTAALAATLVSPAGAVPWHTFGPRAMGMGGAHVAVAQGPTASYWNPAGLGQLYNSSGFEVPFGARGEFTGTVLEGAKDLNEINSACAAGNAAVCNTGRATSALNKINNAGSGVMLDAGVGMNLKIKRVVVFVNNLTYVGGTPRVDYTLGANGAANMVSVNQSRIIVRGLNATEIGVGYGREILETGLTVGANLKGIVGRAGYQEITVSTETSGFGKFNDNIKTSFQPAVDLGLLWDMRETFPSLPGRPRLGFVGRNINNPGFKNPDRAVTRGERSKFPLNGQGRMGLALSPFKFWHLAMDVDLTNNLTPVDGYTSRYMSAGTEVNIFNRPWLNIPLRVGLQKNLADTASGLSYTGGFGFNFVRVHVDVAGMVSSRSTPVQSETKTERVPNNFGAAARLAVLFGGEDDGAGRDVRPSRPAPKPVKRKIKK
ncbi:MAG: hypothetical protein FD126_307 [Elusimicrobia bacterium]|nr:MAG: hypothetical protein FD126_307 [Elusimicrobiota bacterium]